MKKFNLTKIQNALLEEKLDGWLFTDRAGNDPIARRILQIPFVPLSRKQWFYFIPAEGAPMKLVHGFERDILNHLPGKKEIYLGREDMSKKLQACLKSQNKIALQYSPSAAVPSISKVDAGIMELIRTCKVTPVSAADLIQQFTAVMSKAQVNTHLNVAAILYSIQQRVLRYIQRKMKSHEQVTELSLQHFIQKQVKKNGLICEHLPAVACGSNTADPNYRATEKNNHPIYPKSLLQVSYQAREKNEEAVYATTSWLAYVGDKIPEEYEHYFQTLSSLRDQLIALIDQSMRQNQMICGWQVDRKAREFVAKEELGGNYLMPSGHSLGCSDHSFGVQLDDFESRDQRKIVPGLCLTLKPAFYFSDYGLKTEVNIITASKGIQHSSKLFQESIFLINL